ncbi:RNA-directed DNA polymerase, eukaryota, Reverse transcriptase zinc-binding domain protein [Artemisia annua]|uniref:RNA-directed DNA polymerase, eukaryota, Reverse transcriptase zinc-binding domain protein n=1 Tax=Artemisia annua TaxID=35608 RepID=A0A2U1L3B1_ARTAN|nr:RNA-directed DNA polymerase, eukaryota, Reverse transcriptase zinc-binding domain protein [Artemisia annua]
MPEFAKIQNDPRKIPNVTGQSGHSLKNPRCKTLKKLDWILVNDNFVSQFNEANGKFLPYMIPDHSPCELTLPKEMIKCKRAFRFSNFTAHKDEFIQIVKEEWEKEVNGCNGDGHVGSSNTSASSPSQNFINALPQIPQNLESEDPCVITLLTQIRYEQRKGLKSIKNLLKKKKK